MRYIKRFNESNQESEFLHDIRDILLPIEDSGLKVEVYENKDGSDNSMESEGELARIYIESHDEENTKFEVTSEVIECVERLLSYSKSSSFECSIEVISYGTEFYNSSNAESIAYSEFGEDDMSLDDVFFTATIAPIDYIRFIIYKD